MIGIAFVSHRSALTMRSLWRWSFDGQHRQKEAEAGAGRQEEAGISSRRQSRQEEAGQAGGSRTKKQVALTYQLT